MTIHEYSKAALAAVVGVRKQNFDVWLTSHGVELPPADRRDVITDVPKWDESTVIAWCEAHGLGYDSRRLYK